MSRDELLRLLMKYGLEVDAFDDESGVRLRIEIPANRPDLLCVEALAIALSCYMGRDVPEWKFVEGDVQVRVDDSVKAVRPVLVCAVLRGVKFDPVSFASFIELQTKLHEGVCRRRTLASIGTHDLGNCRPPFVYGAERPQDIRFRPLYGVEGVDGDDGEVDGFQLREALSHHSQLSKYLPLLDGKDTWPVIRDSTGQVCSMPPIINSWYSRLTLQTTDIFVDCTALDATRAVQAVLALCTAFSTYTDFVVERVWVDGKLSPLVLEREFVVSVEYLRTLTGLRDLPADRIEVLLRKMMLKVKLEEGGGEVHVTVPVSRSDVLHGCDIAEDLAIAYGYDRMAELAHRIAQGIPRPLNELSDALRREVAHCGFTEVLTFSLCGRDDCFEKTRELEGSAIAVQNAQTVSFEILRTKLWPGMVKVASKMVRRTGARRPLPLRLFEVSDVVLVDAEAETGARNERRIAAAICATKSVFEEIHGLLDRVFLLNGRKYVLKGEDSPSCIAGQRAAVLLQGSGAAVEIGWIGVLHPIVLRNFKLALPVVAFELNVEVFR